MFFLEKVIVILYFGLDRVFCFKIHLILCQIMVMCCFKYDMMMVKETIYLQIIAFNV